MTENNKCPVCNTELGTWTDDPLRTKLGLAGENYKGLIRLCYQHIKELQEKRAEQEIEEGIPFHERTKFSDINIKEGIRKNHIEELRESTEKILTNNETVTEQERTDLLKEYFNYDEEGNEIGTKEYGQSLTKVEWTDPNLSNYKGFIKAIHIEDLRHPIQLPTDAIMIGSTNVYETRRRRDNLKLFRRWNEVSLHSVDDLYFYTSYSGFTWKLSRADFSTLYTYSAGEADNAIDETRLFTTDIFLYGIGHYHTTYTILNKTDLSFITSVDTLTWESGSEWEEHWLSYLAADDSNVYIAGRALRRIAPTTIEYHAEIWRTDKSGGGAVKIVDVPPTPGLNAQFRGIAVDENYMYVSRLISHSPHAWALEKRTKGGGLITSVPLGDAREHITVDDKYVYCAKHSFLDYFFVEIRDKSDLSLVRTVTTVNGYTLEGIIALCSEWEYKNILTE